MTAPLARAVSVAAHPFAMAALMVAGTARAAGPVALVALVAIAPIAVLMAVQVRRGAWADVDASRRTDRAVLFAVALAALGVLLLVLWRRGEDLATPLVRGAVGTLAMLAVAALVTRRVKLSLHLAFAAMAAVVLLGTGSALGWIAAAAVPALAWARLAMGRHRAGEVVAGAALGLLAGWGILGFPWT